MARITTVRAYANNEVVYIAWALDGPIPECRGFDVRRIETTTGEETSLPAWVPFEGQDNPEWQAKTTAIWPVQRLSWKDLTWRDQLDARLNSAAGGANPPIDVVLKYRVVPLTGTASSLEPQEDLGAVSDPVHLCLNFGAISAAFNNGILSTQWLTNELKKEYATEKPLTALKDAIAKPNNPIRTKLAGDSLPFLRRLLERAASEDGTVVLALYELADKELIDLLLKNDKRVKIILSNTSADKSKKNWDGENEPARKKLHASHAQVQDRMFNDDHIGHNKFAILLDRQGRPTTVLTGSTNWTPNGMCAQSNNALLIESPELAAAYYAYWKRLAADKLPNPKPITAPSRNVQGQPLRRANMESTRVALDGGKTNLEVWFSPNTSAATKNPSSPMPPDLAKLFSLMRNAKKAIFFLVFLPSAHGDQSIINEAIKMGEEDPQLLVLGAISSALAMPLPPGSSQKAAAPTRNYLVNTRRTAGRSTSKRGGGGRAKPKGGGAGGKPPVDPVFTQDSIEIVQASALKTQLGDFQAELLSAGNAIIHDKIVVIDPLSDSPVVAAGSHNLGYKASYGNDENLLIIQGNQALAIAYAVHVLDVYDHYRFRAEHQAATGGAKDKAFDGFLADDDGWQQDYIDGRRGTDAPYFSGNGGR